MDFTSVFLLAMFRTPEPLDISTRDLQAQIVTADADRDGIILNDACPDIPAQTSDGCPVIPEAPFGFVPGVTISLDSADYVLKDPQVIKAGDRVSVVLKSEETGEIFSESAAIVAR